MLLDSDIYLTVLNNLFAYIFLHLYIAKVCTSEQRIPGSNLAIAWLDFDHWQLCLAAALSQSLKSSFALGAQEKRWSCPCGDNVMLGIVNTSEPPVIAPCSFVGGEVQEKKTPLVRHCYLHLA